MRSIHLATRLVQLFEVLAHHPDRRIGDIDLLGLRGTPPHSDRLERHRPSAAREPTLPLLFPGSGRVERTRMPSP